MESGEQSETNCCIGEPLNAFQLPASVSITGYSVLAGAVIGQVSQFETDRDTHEKGKVD